MPKTWKILVGAAFVALIGFIMYSTTDLARIRCEVCVEFHGKTSCSPAAATSQDEAVKTAVGIACTDLAAGRTESIACEHTTPKSVSCK